MKPWTPPAPLPKRAGSADLFALPSLHEAPASTAITARDVLADPPSAVALRKAAAAVIHTHEEQAMTQTHQAPQRRKFPPVPVRETVLNMLEQGKPAGFTCAQIAKSIERPIKAVLQSLRILEKRELVTRQGGLGQRWRYFHHTCTTAPRTDAPRTDQPAQPHRPDVAASASEASSVPSPADETPTNAGSRSGPVRDSAPPSDSRPEIRQPSTDVHAALVRAAGAALNDYLEALRAQDSRLNRLMLIYTCARKEAGLEDA
jgi:hypothetical protein